MKYKKRIIYSIMIILILFEMAKVFTPNLAHEIMGIIVIIAMGIHHYYYRKTKCNLLNELLIINLIGIMFSGISISRDLFPDFSISIFSYDLHYYLSCSFLFLLTLHISKYVFSKLKGRKKQILSIVLSIAIACAGLYGIPYLNRHFKTIIVDPLIRDTLPSIELKDTTIVCFTRRNNTSFDENVDLTSTASLLQEGDQVLGTSEYIATIVQNITSSRLVMIQSEFTYSSSYSKTCTEAKKEIGTSPAIEPINTSDSSLVILVIPLWWSTLPGPVETYLKTNDFSSTKLAVIVTNGGGSINGCIEDIEEITGNKVAYSYDLYCEEVTSCKDKIIEFIQSIQE